MTLGQRRARLEERGPGEWVGLFDAMASPCEVHLTGIARPAADRIVQQVAREAWRIERKFSRYQDDNIVHEINTSEGRVVRVDEETARFLDYAAELYRLSEGMFDVTSGVLRRAWRFDGSDRIPANNTVIGLLANVGWRRVSWQRPFIRLEPGMEIDLGGIGKEYAVDRAAEEVAAATTACLINFGGDLRALGPRVDGRAWQVGIESAEHQGTARRLIDLSTGGLATSGDSRRFLLKDGRRYSHILNPLTGWPVEGAARSITVAAPTCTEAGMLATLAMLQGSGAESFLEQQNARYWCMR